MCNMQACSFGIYGFLSLPKTDVNCARILLTLEVLSMCNIPACSFGIYGSLSLSKTDVNCARI